MCYPPRPSIKGFLPAESRSSPGVIKALTLSRMRLLRSGARLGKLGAPVTAVVVILGCRPDLSAQNYGTPVAGDAPVCEVERVVDGDTFVCRPARPGGEGERVRLLLIDTPELAQAPFGAAARDSALALIPPGTRVRLDFDVSERDRFGRLLAYVWVDSVMLNRELVRRGMAVVAVFPPDVRERDMLRAASDSARAERRGLWSGSAFDCAPADYRAGRCGREPGR